MKSTFLFFTAALFTTVGLALNQSDVDIPAATASYNQALSFEQEANHRAEEQEQRVHETEHRYFDKLSEQKQAQTNLDQETQLLKDIQAELPSLQNQVIQLTKAISDLDNDRNQATAELSQLQSGLLPLQNQLAKVQGELSQLQQTLSQQQASAAPVEGSIQNLQKQMGETNGQIQTLQSSISKLAAQISSIGKEISETQFAIDAEKAKQGPDQTKISQWESQIQQLQSSITSLAGQATQAQAQVNSLNQALKQKDSEIAGVKLKLAPAQTAVQNIEVSVSSLQGTVGQLQGQENSLNTEIANAESQVTQLASEISAEKSKPHPNQALIAKLESQKSQQDYKINTAKTQLQSVTAQLSQKQSALANAESQLNVAKANLQPILNQLAALQSEEQSIQSQLSNANVQLQSLEGGIKSSQNQIGSLQTEIQSEKQKQGPNLATIANFETKKSQLESSLSSLNQKLVDNKSSLVNAEQKLSSLNSQFQQEEQVLAPIQKQINKTLADIASANNKLSTIQGGILSLNEKIQTKETQIQNDDAALAKNHAALKETQDGITHHGDKVAEQTKKVFEAHHILDKDADETKEASNDLNREKHELEEKREQARMAREQREQSYAFLQQVQTNYQTEQNRIAAMADGAGNSDGLREAQERANGAGKSAGLDGAGIAGANQGTADARLRDQAKGYRDGTLNGASNPALASSYQSGLGVGSQIAQQKSLGEDFAKGYNSALSNLLASPPPGNSTVDITDQIPQDAGDAGADLSSTPKDLTPVASPFYPLPVDPVYVAPSPGIPSFTVPGRDNRYFNPPCSGLVLAEFTTLCQQRYDNAYSNGFGQNYAALFGNAYVDSFNSNVKAAYDSAYAQNFSDSFSQGQLAGASDQGTVDGFQNSYAGLATTQKAAGQKAFLDSLSTGNLLVVRSAGLVDGNNDGVFEPGEGVKLAIVIDNYGHLTAPLKKLRVRISGKSGLENLNFDLRDLPAIPAQTRVTLVGAVSATVAHVLAGDPVSIGGSVERTDGFVLLPFSDSQKAHYPIEVTAVKLDHDPSVNEAVQATVKIKNWTHSQVAAGSVSLSSSPQIVTVSPATLTFPQLQSQEETSLPVTLTPGIWVGENAYVKFLSGVSSGDTKTVQEIQKYIHLNRFGSLLIYDANGNALSDSKLTVTAGSPFSVSIQVKSNSGGGSQGNVNVRVARTSDPALVSTPDTQASFDYGMLPANYVGERTSFSFDVPASLKGKTGYVLLQLSDGDQVVHAPEILLEIK